MSDIFECFSIACHGIIAFIRNLAKSPLGPQQLRKRDMLKESSLVERLHHGVLVRCVDVSWCTFS